MAPRYTSRTVTVVETTIPCPACRQDLTRSVTEPGMVFCGNSRCPQNGVHLKEKSC